MPLSEREKMLADQPYRSSDPELVQARQRARLLTARFNATSPLDPEQRHTILRDLLGGVGAGVWIEFEAGDVDRPIWSGCFWGTAEAPMAPPASPPLPTTKIWRSETGLSAVIDDVMQTITITDATGQNKVEVNALGQVTVKGLARIVVDGPLIQVGSQAAARPAVLGDQLMTYLAQIVTMFNTHMHPGELAGGILPVTPAPPVPPMPPPAPNLLSVKIFLE